MVKVYVKYTKLFINNEWVEAVSKKRFPTINPQDETVIAQVAEAGKEDISLAVAAAKKAFHRYSKWRTMDASGRSFLILKLADLIESQARYLAELETLDCGKPVREAENDVYYSASILRYYAGIADKIFGNTIPADGNVMSFTLKEPVGVCGQIISWSYPIPMLTKKIAPALAAGCTIVLKPAEQTPLTSLAIAALVKEAGFPPGVINIVPGSDIVAGTALAAHPDIDKVSFTGSSEIGRVILGATAVENLKRVTLEFACNSPLVVFDNCDVEKAAQIAHAAAFSNGGQCIYAGTKTYVQSSVYDQFVQKARDIAKKRSIGNPFEDVQQGPQIDKNRFENVLKLIETGKKDGAKLLVGGKRIHSKGYYIEPTVFADVNDNMKIAREKIFGPVQCILKFNTFEEVVDRLNDANYGLAASAITDDVTTALNFAKLVRTGSIWINTYDHVTSQTPFGGFKNSGIGRELGEDGVSQYLECKTVTLSLPKVPEL